MPESSKLESWKIWLPTFVGLATGLGMLLGLGMAPKGQPIVIENNDEEPTNSLGNGRMEELIRYIDARYVDDVEDDELVEGAINHILDDLDPHSSYIPKDELKETTERLQGNFDGIGIEFMILDDTLMVVTPIAGGPSEEAGILAGDKIVEVGDTIIAGKEIKSEKIMTLLRGEKGTDVELGVRRGKENKLRRFTITRDKIPNNSVDIGYMVNENTGYIKINRFNATTYKDFMLQLEDLVEKQNMNHLVLDLRQNPGGYLMEATRILSQLFNERDKLMVYTEGDKSTRQDYNTTGANFFDVGKIAVLIDEGSASASEIVAGAIQDWDRGIIIGRRTFGKGLVQEQYKLSDGSALHLTVSRYFTPSGRCIQRDYTNAEAYEDDFTSRFKSGELQDQSKIELVDTTEYYTAGGRVVYGGGGVMPDVFVPLDTTLYSTYYLKMRQKVAPFIFRYVENNKSTLKSWKEETAYFDDFEVSDQMFKEFLAYAEKDKSLKKRNDKILTETTPDLKMHLKARLAKHLFDQTALHKVINFRDPMLKEATQWIAGEEKLVEIRD